MEYLLTTWLDDCNQKGIAIKTNNIRVKTFSLFSSLKENKFKMDTTTFSASRGWCEVFRAQTGIHYVRLTGKAASADKDAPAKFPACFKKIITMTAKFLTLMKLAFIGGKKIHLELP
jgi:hypothetical protein